MAKLWLYYVIIILLFFSQTYAVTTSDELIQNAQKSQSPLLIDWSTEQNNLIAYAWSISKDFDFILTVFAESGFRPDAVGDHWHSKWVCQWDNLFWRQWIQDDPNFQDWKRQIDQCYRSYSIWSASGKISTRLYWYNVRLKYKDRFTNVQL